MRTKLCVAFHKPAELVRDNSYLGILAGAAIVNDKSKDGFLKSNEKDILDKFCQNVKLDSQGSDNISVLNRSLNEMTAVYWMWKNYIEIGNPDIVGLCHYRRYFIFDERLELPSKMWLPYSHVHCFYSLDDLGDSISSNKLEDIFNSGYNILASYPYDARFASGNSIRNCEERFYQIYKFQPGLYKKMEKLVLERHPEYEPEVVQLRNQPIHFLFNMFVTTKEIFFEYCEFIFPILFSLTSSTDSERDMVKMRGPGFLSEFLTSMFISHGIRTGKLRLKQLAIAYVENTDIKAGDASKQDAKSKFCSIKLILELFVWLITFSKANNRKKIETLKLQLSNEYLQKGKYSSTYKLLSVVSRVFSKLSKLFRL